MKKLLLTTTILSVAAIASATAAEVSNDSLESIKIFGRIQYDKVFHTDGGNDAETFSRLRRARLGVEGDISDVWSFKFENDFASGYNIGVTDAYIKANFEDKGHIRIGQFKEAFSLEEITSSNDITFAERAVTVSGKNTGEHNFGAPSRNLGIAYGYDHDMFTFNVGYFGDPALNGGTTLENGQQVSYAIEQRTNAEGGLEVDVQPNNIISDERQAITGRITVAPVHNDDVLLHLGASYNLEDSSNKEINGLADNQDKALSQFAFEIAANAGPLHGQFEYHFGQQGHEEESGEQRYKAFYVQVGLFLTGESRAYSKGIFVKTKAEKEMGAIEVAYRYDRAESEIGTEKSEYSINSFAINYYHNDNVRLLANFSIEDDNDAEIKTDPSTFTIRAQLDF